MFAFKIVIVVSALVLNPGLSGVLANTANPCAEDVGKFCRNVESGDGRLARCLKQHETDLSPVCRQSRVARKEKISDISRTCQTDIHTHCSDVTPGGGRVARCLKDHQSRLTPACQVEMRQVSRN